MIRRSAKACVLLFALRVNPIRTRHDEHGKHKRHDIIMDEKKKLEHSRKPRKEWPTSSEIAHEQGVNWLTRRADKNGFSIADNEVRADGYTQRSLYKGKEKKNHKA